VNIVVLDRMALGDDIDMSIFEKLGKLTIYERTATEEVVDRLKDADALLTNKVVIGKAEMDRLPKLRYIGINATGTNNIDLAYAAKKNIAVTNVKSYSTDSVVQHTFALLFYVYEKLRHYDDFVKQGKYSDYGCFTYFGERFAQLSGKTWGIIGLGEIGRKVADIAKAFGCHVVYYSTSGKNSNPNYERAEFDELLRSSDIISIHAPLNDRTQNLMNRAAFEKMKPEAVLINVGRGPIVNESDLLWALNENKIAAAGLDVLSVEPMRKDNPLYGYKDSNRLIITPHIAWATNEARKRLVDEAYLNLEAFINGKERNRV
jgi:lactate dehydrogenase-like 2-hydroxyacid dehydrogenase